ncbi:MAG: NAD(P)/FAD-dependent oxidoreductase [Burkholderiales bacterium]|nr:NAD(P)/FAD-dependent oxidoreductase [Burkholderiales bacterium]
MNDIDASVLARVAVQNDETMVSRWLESFEIALIDRKPAAIAALFAADSHWRDLLAFTWHITPHRGAEQIATSLAARQAGTQARGFTLARERTPPRRIRRLGLDVIEAIFTFETAVGRGNGVVRLLADEPSKAWIFLTSLEELKGFEEQVGARRPTGSAYSRNFGGDNWLDQRHKSQAYEDREPTVLVVGAGQAGLSVAARLRQLGIDTLCIDKHERIGDNWRKRYHSLALHNQIQANHLPYLPFPPTWPKYIPKDMLANWFETYAWALEINVWTGTELIGGSYAAAAGRWQARVRRADGSERTLSPRHLVFANGVSGIPRIPELPGLSDFAGEIIHSHSFVNGAPWRGKRALVLGTGNSGHDVAQDLYSHGVDTTIIQRGSTTVVSVDPSAKLNYAIYDEGPPLEDCDLIAVTATYPLLVKGYQLAVERMVEMDKDLIAALVARGFKHDLGEDGTGHQMKYRRRGGGYYLDVGCSRLIIDGTVGLLQFEQIERFVAAGALLEDGSIRAADLLVLATGYHTQQGLVRRLLGDAVADSVGPVWGIGADGEMANMWKRTAHEGLWFMAGSLAQCRIYSKHLALQIKAIEQGLMPKESPGPDGGSHASRSSR